MLEREMQLPSRISGGSCILSSMSNRRQVRLVLNPGSGRKEISPEALRERFGLHGCDCVVTLLSRSIDLPALHKSDASDVVWIAAGGDGTVNCVAHALTGTGRTMGVLPAGTLNHFAQDLGIPAEMDAAIEVAATGLPRVVDAAEVNGLTFVNNSSLGVYPAMVLDRDRMCRRGAGKWWAMLVASVRAFLRFRRLHFTLEVDGAVRSCTTTLLFVGNNIYSTEGEVAGKRNRLDEGILSVFFVPNANRSKMVRAAASMLNKSAQNAGLEMFHVEHFSVTSHHRRLRVALDGEVRRMPPPLVYRSRPGALSVIAPPPLQPQNQIQAQVQR